MSLNWALHFCEGVSPGDHRAILADLVRRLQAAGVIEAPNVIPAIDKPGPKSYVLPMQPANADLTNVVVTEWLARHRRAFDRVIGPAVSP